ncbi:MAG TPA: tRNA uridine(34) 5-carboxymethylaminomethyl modification radical SAM/GNAT enzyme Elp3 [Candidatus Nanoarchaeia archaeon]|nr:tRNA uridine(34) 5-carboxymethylaminomethyl modification radical SAM/GNAT enzyme Elp3 [Candidatus Nanoarchaeia archaeon]
MDYFNEACMEIIAELKKSDAITKHDFNRIKTKVLDKYKSKVNVIPKNADIYFIASEEDRKKFKDILSLKPVRTISGVSPIALMSDPYPCPHSMKGIGPCSYCPGGPGSPFGDVPQSYTGKEPSTRRSIRNNYDPYLVVFNRLEHYIAMGKVPDKAEIIIQGGTFTFFPKAYQEYFVKYSLKAMNDFSKLFFNEGSTLDIEKFKIFFELPRVISKEDERTVKVQQKLLKIKQLDLNNKENLENANRMIFRTEISSDNNNFLSNDSGVNESNDNAGNNLVTLRLTKQKTSLNVIESQIDSNLLAIKRVQDKLKNENNVNLSLKQIQKDNETSVIRCVGLTIETKSDFGKLYHGNLMLELGCTRVELGIQSIYDEVLDATNRGNSVNDNIESIRILKDLGFKINAHYMPGLPGTTKDMDMHGLRQLFESGEYMPDMLKLYPCIVMEGTKLYDDWKSGKFVPLTTKDAADMIAETKRFVPRWCRIMRVQRDIPTYVTSSGVDKTNLRQYVEKICKEKGIKCKCIRCREAGFFDASKIDYESMQIKVTEYTASNGKEFFIEAVDSSDILFGFCRLRFPSEFLREEITKDSALIREIHVFSAAAQIGTTNDDSFQHRGIGTKLLIKAEEIAKQNNKDKIVIISGIGAREYFRKFDYEMEGVYMVKSV